MTTVTGTVIRPGGEPLSDARIEIKLVASTSDPNASGYIPADEVEVWTPQTLRTDDAGTWTADLPPTAGADNVFSQTGLVYKVIYQIGRTDGVHYIDVPDSGSALWVGDLLVDPPDDLDAGGGGGGPTTAALVLVDTSNFDSNLSAADTTVQKALETLDDLIAGAGGAVDSVNGQTGIVVLTAADVDAVPTSAAGVTGGFAPLDAGALIPTAFLPPFVSTVQGSSGAIQLDAADIPFDPTGFTGLLVGKTELQEVTAIVDALDFTGSGAVDSVNGQIGTVVLDAAAVGAVDLTDVGVTVAPLDGTQLVPLVNLPPFVSTIDGQSGAVDVVGTMVALDTVTFDGVLDGTTVDVQALAQKVDDLTFIGAGAVDSVNSQIGVVQLNAINIPVDASAFAGNLDAGDTDVQAIADALDALVFPADAVDSVNGQTGVVVLGPAEVGALDVDLLAAANGVAPLDVDGFVPYVNLPPLVTSLNGSLTGDVNLTGTMVAIDPSGFTTNLDNTITDVQLLAEAVDLLIPPVTNSVISVNGFDGEVVLTAADLGAVDVALISAVDGVASLDGAGTVPTTELPDVVFSVNSLGGVVDLDAAAIPVDDSGFVGSLVGVTDLQGVADVLDTFAGGTGGGHELQEGGTPLTQRAGLNFLTGFDLADNSGADSTDITLDLTEYAGGALALTSGGTGGTSALTARSNLGVYSTTEVDTLVNDTAANVGKRVAVRTATTANITIATALNNGDTLDGLTLTTNDLVLVKDQSSPAQNGIYVVGASPARDTDFSTWDDYPASLVTVNAGTTNATTAWLCTSNTGGTLNTTAITYAQIASTSGSGQALLLSEAVHQTANPVLLKEGSPLVVHLDHNLDYNEGGSGFGYLGPNYSIARVPANWEFGSPGSGFPRGAVTLEGDITFSFDAGINAGPVGFIDIRATQNPAGVARSLTNSNSFIDNHVYIAKGATCGWALGDGFLPPITAYPAISFTSAPMFTRDRTLGGQLNGSSVIGYYAGPMNTVGSHMLHRWGIYVDDADVSWSSLGVYTPGTLDYACGLQMVTQATGTRNIAINYGPSSDPAVAPLFRVEGDGAVISPAGFYGSETGGLMGISSARNGSSIGAIILDSAVFTVGPVAAYTHTGSSSLTHFAFSRQFTLNATGGGAGTGNAFNLLTIAPTVIYDLNANSFGNSQFQIVPTIKNKPTEANALGRHFSLYSVPTFTADGATTSVTYTGINEAPVFAVTNSGTLTAATATNVNLGMSIGTGVTIANRTALDIADFTGSGTATIQYGIHIEPMTKGAINVGFLNENQTVSTGPIYGGVGLFSGGDNLTLSSTPHATKGQVRLDNPFVRFLVSNYTATAAYTLASVDGIVTLNAASNNTSTGYVYQPTIRFDAAPNVFGGGVAFSDSAIYENVNEANNLGPITSYASAPTLRSQTATITGDYLGFTSGPATARVGASGSITLGAATGFTSNLTVGANTTVTTRRGVLINNPTVAGTLTTNVGIDIAAQTTGTTIIGFRNASTTVLPEQVWTFSTGSTFNAANASTIRLNNTSAGSVTITGVPTLLDGQDGQEVEIYNGGAQNVVLQDQGTLAGSNLRLMTTTVTLTPRDSITLKYSSTVGDWRQTVPIATVI